MVKYTLMHSYWARSRDTVVEPGTLVTDHMPVCISWAGIPMADYILVHLGPEANAMAQHYVGPVGCRHTGVHPESEAFSFVYTQVHTLPPSREP